ncbi:MAG: hypothetical protein IKV91_01360 [Bacteroidales bacterium]|nr:hypothetical protein [Bacteroidales bacterium]
MEHRVHWFSRNDMSIGYHLPRIEQIIEEFNIANDITDINDILELFEITKFVDNGACPKSWGQDMLSMVKQFKPIVAKYFKQITKSELSNIYRSIDFGYRDSFWEIIDVFEIKGLIDENFLQTSFNESWELRELMYREKLVKRHGGLLRKFLISNPHSAEWLLNEYVAEHSIGGHKTMYFPTELTSEDVSQILEKYIDSDDPNINYVRLLEHTKLIHTFKVSPSIRLKAKRKAKKLNDKMFSGDSATRMHYAYSVIIRPNAASKSVEYDEDGTKCVVYDVDELVNSSISGTLRLLRTHFDMLSYFNLLDLIPKESEVESLEKIFGIRSKRNYDALTQFKLKEMTSTLHMESLYFVLTQHGKNLEDIISEYYNVYLKDRFGYPSLMLSLPKHGDWFTKCRLIYPEIESIARQYQLYVENDEIDPELLELSDPMKVTSIKSKLDVRYYKINPENKDIQLLLQLLFSDQTMLTYIDPYKENRYKNFCHMMMNVEEVPFDSYPEYERSTLNTLVNLGCIRIDDDGMIRVVDQFDFTLYKLLYDYGVIPSYFMYANNTGKIDVLLDKGWVLPSDNLLTPKEQDYYSYYLDNERFDDGPAYRNKYAHANKVKTYDDEKGHKYAYYRMLLLLMILLLRIEDDLMQRQISIGVSQVEFVGMTSQSLKVLEVYAYMQYLKDGSLRTI